MTPNQLRILSHVLNAAVALMPTDTRVGWLLAHLLPIIGVVVTEMIHAKHKAKPVPAPAPAPRHNHKKRK